MAVVDIPEAEAREIQAKDRELWAIQERLIDILCMQPDRTIDPSEEAIRQPKTTHRDKAMEKGHLVERVGSHYYGMRCGQSWLPKDTRRFTLMSRGDCPGLEA